VAGSLSVSDVGTQAPVVSHGLRCSVSYSYWHPSAVHDYYKYRVRVENDTTRGKRIDVGVTIIQGPSGDLPDLHKRFGVHVAPRSTKTVHNWFKVLHNVEDVTLSRCSATG
jgi:hypothetical protein